MGRKYSYGGGKKYGRKIVRVQSIEDALVFQRSFGFPVSIRIAADVAGVSRQRMHTLLRKGRFTCVLFRGEPTHFDLGVVGMDEDPVGAQR